MLIDCATGQAELKRKLAYRLRKYEVIGKIDKTKNFFSSCARTILKGKIMVSQKWSWKAGAQYGEKGKKVI